MLELWAHLDDDEQDSYRGEMEKEEEGYYEAKLEIKIESDMKTEEVKPEVDVKIESKIEGEEPFVQLDPNNNEIKSEFEKFLMKSENPEAAAVNGIDSRLAVTTDSQGKEPTKHS